MERTIDRFGRVVIPKRLREDLGLKVGEPLVIQEQGGGVLVRLARKDDRLKRKGRVLVFTADITRDAADLVRKARDERMRKVIGRSCR